MRPEELTAFGEIAGDAVAGLASQARDMHEGIAERVFAAVGPAAAPVQQTHDLIAAGAWSAARVFSRALVRGGAVIAGATRPPDAPSVERSHRARLVLGALNGAFGDALHASGNELAARMTLRHDGRELDVAPDVLRDAFPGAGGRVVVFIHGLCETDDAWRLGAARHPPYGLRLQSELGYTPLYVRYNTGRHISENGRELAALLDRLENAWPGGIDELALVGHSMGGLVARSACHYADGHSWPGKVRHVFTLGSPHFGAPLEKAATLATGALSRLPETRGFARALKARSSGIKDLGHGYLVDEDWSDQDPEAFFQQAGSEIPFLSCANHYFVCATVSRDPDAPAGRLIGDLLVLRSSAWAHRGRGERMRFPIEHYRHVGGANHFDLLNHPAIYAEIRTWLAGRPELPVGVPAVAGQRP